MYWLSLVVLFLRNTLIVFVLEELLLLMTSEI